MFTVKLISCPMLMDFTITYHGIMCTCPDSCNQRLFIAEEFLSGANLRFTNMHIAGGRLTLTLNRGPNVPLSLKAGIFCSVVILRMGFHSFEFFAGNEKSIF